MTGDMMTGDTTTGRLAELAAAWAAADPDPVSAAQLMAAVRDTPDLVAPWFARRLTFGTAGLRGPMGPGPNQMNRVIVRVAARAVGLRLQAETELDAANHVVIGFDARHLSRDFALDTARVLVSLGIEATLIDGPVPTPVLAHHVLRLGAGAGVMVTASHNPPADNGYKVYWTDGAQIGPALANDIEALMDGPLVTSAELADHEWVPRLGATTAINNYLTAAIDPAIDAGPDGLEVAYTAMHGVGTQTLLGAFERAGLPRPHLVASQVEPDPDFPTVALPNPEEAGALDEAMASADVSRAELIIANDPDADRLGVAVATAHGWQLLTGDQIGALLADELLGRGSGPDRVVACSLVSSPLLDVMSAARGVHMRRTSTGFKWIIRAAIDEPELEYVFGYEEALGFACSSAARDKDGITAAVEIVRIARQMHGQGLTLLDRLAELGETYGYVATGQVTQRFDDDPSALAIRVADWRHEPPAGLDIRSVIDHALANPPTDLLEWHVGDHADRVLIRASGTEPKLKAYLHVVGASNAAEANQRLATLAAGVHAACSS